jgi:hypothetical protein
MLNNKYNTAQHDAMINIFNNIRLLSYIFQDYLQSFGLDPVTIAI